MKYKNYWTILRRTETVAYFPQNQCSQEKHMNKIKPADYGGHIKYIDKKSCGAVYPYSIAEGFQQGDVYADSRSALFWHYSGFAFLCDEYGEDVLDFASNLLVNADRRFILFVDDECAENYFRKNKNTVIEKDCF